VLCLALATLSPGRAAPDRVQVLLTGPLVERYIKSRAEFEMLFKRLETRFGPVAQEEGEDELLGIARYLDRSAPRAEVNAVLKRHGFTSFDQWSNVSYAVLLAAGTALSPATGGTLDEEKAKVVQQIQSDTALSPEDKQRQLADLDEQFAALAQFTPKPENMDAVRPYLDRLKPLIGDDQ
jgi:tellurite resistance protein